MGIFHEESGRFDIVLRLDYAKDDVSLDAAGWSLEIEMWRRSFQRASELLFYATGGQHRLGRVYVCPVGSNGHAADVFLHHDLTGGSFAAGRIWLPGTHVDLEREERFHPFVVLHELAHYLYGLRDESVDADGDTASCLGLSAASYPYAYPGACIMEASAGHGDELDLAGNLTLKEVTDFCSAANHDRAPEPGTSCTITIDDNVMFDTCRVANDTNQHATYGKSCWETMVDHYPDLVLPEDLPEAATGPVFPAPIRWIRLFGLPRFVILYDVSEEFTNGHPLLADLMREAIFEWVEHSDDGELLGLVAAGDPLHSLEIHGLTTTRRGEIEDFVESTGPEPGGSLSAATGSAVGMIRAAGEPSATQVILLVSGSDGPDAGLDTDGLIDLLREENVRVYSIAVSPDANATRLRALARGTGGRFVRIRGASLPAFRVRKRLRRLFRHIHRGGGVITAAAARQDDWDPGLPPLPGSEDAEPFVEETVTEAHFTLDWEGEREFEVELVSPDGTRYSPDTDDADVRVVELRGGGLRFAVTGPAEGPWRLETGMTEDRERELSVQRSYFAAAGSTTEVAVSSLSRLWSLSDEVPVFVRVEADRVLTNVDLAVTVTDPEERVTTIAVEAEPNAGVYQGSFRPETEGAHRIDVVADNRARIAVPATGGDRAGGENEKNRLAPARAFLASGSLRIEVGPPVCAEPVLKPESATRGERTEARLSLGGMPWVPPASRLHAGPGVRIRATDVPDEKGLLPLDIDVAENARPGPREVVLKTRGRIRRLGALLTILEDPDYVPDAPSIDECRLYPGKTLRNRCEK